MLLESVPNFSEGRRQDVIDDIAAAAGKAYLLDVDADPDHNRTVVSIAGSQERVVESLLGAIAVARDRIDLASHEGVHPRVGAADVVPIVPLSGASLDQCRAIAHALGERVWASLQIPVYFYGHGEEHSLADIRAGRVSLDIGGPQLHPTAGAVCIGARRLLVAFNVVLYDFDLTAARGLARALRETSAGLRGVQALAFQLSGDRVQLSMNLFRVDETTPTDVLGQLEREGVSFGAEQIVGLCPAMAAHPAANSRLLEGRLAAASARGGAERCRELGDEEHVALGSRLEREADDLSRLSADEDAILAGAERSAALIPVLRAAKVLDDELEAMLGVAARGLRAAVSPATQAIYRARVDALDARL